MASCVQAIMTQEHAQRFLKEMKSEAIAATLKVMGLIPAEIEHDINHSKSREKANGHLWTFLKQEATEEQVLEVFKVAYEKAGYGKMNKLAADILELLQQGPCVSVEHSKTFRIPKIKGAYVQVKTVFVEVCTKPGAPSLEEVKDFCMDLIEGVFMDMPPNRRHQYDIERSKSMTELARVVCFRLSRWISYDFFKEVIDHFQPALESVREQLMHYEDQLKPLLVQKLERVAELKQREEAPDSMAELVVKHRLDADGLLMKDLVAERDFLAQRLGVPEHLLQVLSWEEGSITITYWIVRDVLPLAELALCREDALVQLSKGGVEAIYLDCHPSEHTNPMDQSMEKMHLKRRTIVTVLDEHQRDLDVKTLTTGLGSMGILTREQCQKLTAMVDSKKRHEALLYALIAQDKPDCYDKLLPSEYMIKRSLSLAAALQATFKALKRSPSSLAVIGSSQFVPSASTISPAVEEVPYSVTLQELLFEFRSSFHTGVNIASFIKAMDQDGMLKKKDKRTLERSDEIAKKNFVYSKLYGGKSITPDRVVKLLEDTGNEQNVHFAKTLLSKLSSLQESAKSDTTSVATITPVVEDVPSTQTAQVLTISSLPPFKYHYSLDDNPSAIFSSTGGVLYSPVNGVTVHIPAEAILGEEQVEVSFRLVDEEAETQEFLSHFEGSVLCSGVFEFEAKLVDASDGEEFRKFHSDVWIELPHCLSFGGCSLKDYSTAFVMSERGRKVEVEEQALFSEGYPYVNLPVRHFSKFCAIHTPRKKRFEGALHVRKVTRKLCVSNSLEKNHSASPHDVSKVLKQMSQEEATSTAAKKRELYFEMKKTSSEASAEERRQALIRQDACANQVFVRQDASDKNDEEDAMEVDQLTELQQEPVNETSVDKAVVACVCQPVGRRKMDKWTAEIVFAPLLHSTLKELVKCPRQMKSEIRTVAFYLDVHLQMIRLHSEPSIHEWSVELSTKEILFKHLTTVTQLLEEGTKMTALLPGSLATVHNKGASLPLHHPVTVEGSWPTAHCYLTCKVGPQCVKGVNTSNAPTGHQLQGLTASITTQGAPSEPLPPTIELERDRYVLALLSIMVPEDQLVTLGEYLGLSHLKTDQVMLGYTAGSALNVGERAYEMFRRASRSGQALTFGKVLVGLNEIGRSDDLVPILRSYRQSEFMSRSFQGNSSGTPAEVKSDLLHSVLFTTWLHANHPTLLPRVGLPGIANDRVISPEKLQQKLFKGLSRRMVCVWRMVGRLLGLPDYEIEAIDIEGRRSGDRECELCYQLLLKWVEYSRPSDVTYYRLMTALELTSLGGSAALDATTYLIRFVMHLTSARR